MSNMFTKEQLDIAKKHGLTRDNVYRRVKFLDWTIEKAITTPPKSLLPKETMTIQGKFVSKENLEIAYKNGIAKKTVVSRLRRGLSVEEAIKPLMIGNEEMHEKEVKEVIGRLKYLNWTIPKGLIKRAAELNLNIDSIKLLEVEMDDNEKEILCGEAD